MASQDYSGMLHNTDYTDPFSEKNRIHITQIGPGYAKGELAVGADSLNFGGLVHGGALATLADMVGGTCACSKGGTCVTANCSMEFLRPAKGKKIVGEGFPVKLGSSLSVVRVELRNDEGDLVATGTFTFYMLKDEKRGKS